MNHSAILRERACPTCTSPARFSLPTAYARDSWRIVKCLACDFPYLPQVPEATCLEEDLAWEKTHSAEAEYRRKSYPVIEAVEHWTRWRYQLVPRVQPANIVNKQAQPGPVILW